MKRKSDRKDRNSLLSLIAFRLWNNWKERNISTFRELNPNVPDVIERIKRFVAEFNHFASSTYTDRVSNIQSHMGTKPIFWQKPVGDAVKINCNGAFDRLLRDARIGIIAKNSEGKLVGGHELS